VAKQIAATHIYAGSFSVSVQEYGVDQSDQALLVRVSSDAVVTLGFDLPPVKALELSEALSKHAMALLSKSAEVVELS
jgi:hypothetical protein